MSAKTEKKTGKSMKHYYYKDGKWEPITEDDGAFHLVRAYEDNPEAEEILNKGFNTSVLLREGSLRTQFFAKSAPNLPKEVMSLVDTVFPFFFTDMSCINPIPDNERGLGIISICEDDKEYMNISWGFCGNPLYDARDTVIIPPQVSDILLKEKAKIDTAGLHIQDLFAGVPNCLKKYYSSIEAVEQRRVAVLKNSIAVVNKSLQVLNSFTLSSIKVFAEVSPKKGISTEDFGYGYRISGIGGVELIFYMLNDTGLS